MANDDTTSGMPVLSAFDKLKLSSNSNNYNMNRSSCNVNNLLSNRSSQNEKRPNSMGVKIGTGTASVAAETPDVANFSVTESLKCEKSINPPLAQFECNNKTIIMYGNSELNTTLVSSSCNSNGASGGRFHSICGNKRASGSSQFSALPSLSNTLPKNEQTFCKAIDTTSGTLSSLMSTAITSISASNNSSLGMILPSNNDDTMFPNQAAASPPLLSANLMMPNKVKKNDANEISVKMLKSGKCKPTVPISSASVPSSTATITSAVQQKLKSASIICAPPPMVLTSQSIKFENNASNKKSSSKGNFGFPKMPSKIATTSSPATNKDENPQLSAVQSSESRDTAEGRNKKKRCSDRYDSSESSDSGVATSLSCTDSSTASSDASDPGSPYSPILLGDDLQHKTNMPPQTILTTVNGDATKSPSTSAATPVQNVLKGSKQQKHHTQNKGINIQQPQKQNKIQTPPPLKKISQHPWAWASINSVIGSGENVSEMASSPKTNHAGTPNTKLSNKRHSQSLPSTAIDGGAKKCRTVSNNVSDNTSGGGLQSHQTGVNNKRLKLAAVEESQTKITGYFKSQMKAQMHYQSGLKKDNIILPKCTTSSTPNSTTSAALTTVVSSSSLASASNSIVSVCSPGETNLNKYFNMISLQSQLREDKEGGSGSTLSPLPPALKKIERSKPTKIAQVAPNLRKTTALPVSSQIVEKSPKKHVAIAPRTAESRQNKQSDKTEQSVPSPIKAPSPPQQQSAVLLTAIRIPQPSQPPQLVSTSPKPQMTVANLNTAKTQQNVTTTAGTVGVASKIPTGPSLYQIPMMPNLVQFPNLIATNVSQLSAARTNHHPHSSSTAQYYLNGTVFKLQQFTAPSTGTNPPTFSLENENQSINTATVTTTSTNIEQHASNTKNTSSITATSFQEMLSNQFQSQQQPVPAHNHRLHPSQPVFMATTAGLLLNAASLPAMLGSNKQTMTIQSQQIPALQPIQGASAAVMPALSSIFSSHQDVATQQLQQFKSEQVSLDAQNSIQQTQLPPPLTVSSSAFSKLAIMKAGATFTPSIHQVSATQPPPLVTISSGTQSIVSVKTNGYKSSPTAKSYQKQRIPQQENLSTKHKQSAPENANKTLSESVRSSVSPPPPKSPPALAYPTITINKEEPKRTEDIFDLLKSSDTEKNPISSPGVCKEEERSEVVELSSFCEFETSSLPATTETKNCSFVTLSSDENKLDESLSQSPNNSSLEGSTNSSLLISSENPKLVVDSKQGETMKKNLSETLFIESLAVTLSPTIDTTLVGIETLPKSAISPILSQPKTIRFPAKHESGHRFGPKGMRRHDGVCYWDKCNKKHESNSKLLDHMQTLHVNTQTGPFACLWLGCKVYGRESCSRRWLERHVLSHGGTKPFKCIVGGCGLRFGSQLALQKHVNGHFTATENKDSTSKRTSDPPVPKLLRKNGKKLRYRRQPFSARMFDFFDAGIMEGLQHRLRQISTLTNGNNCITFQGEIIMRRKNSKGFSECYVQWSPSNMISDEWLPESNKPYLKTISINRMKPIEKTNVESLLKSAYRLPYSPNLFESFHSLSRQSSQDSSSGYSQSISTSDDTTDETSRSSSIGNSSVGSNNSLPAKLPQMELRKKQSRKPPKRIQPT